MEKREIEDHNMNDLLTLRIIADNLEDMMSEDSANDYRKCFDRVIKYCLHDSISKDKIKTKIDEIEERAL